jgi:hypothetical protein
MSSRSTGNVPEQVHRLAEILTKKFERSLVKSTPKLSAEIDQLLDKLKSEGFTVAIVAIKDEVSGDVTAIKLAVYRIGTVPSLN